MERIHALGRALVSPLLDWLAPPRCAACDALVPLATDVFCPDCAASVEPLHGDVCPLCSAPGWRALCDRCRRKPPPYGRAQARFLWGGAIAQAVRRCKYGSRLDIATGLGALWAPLLERVGHRAELLIPVPMSSAGLRSRGFDQVLEMVRGARRAGAVLPPLCSAVLVKPRDRPAQASLPPSERRRLTARAFRVRRPERVRGRRVLLLDDVMTTGATVGACGAALRSAGAVVEVVTLARAG